MTPRQVAKTLGIKLPFEDFEKKGDVFSFHQVRRRARYYCGAMKRKSDGENNTVRVPKKLIEYYESLNGFEGWSQYSRSWDITKEDPLTIYFRTFSVEEEWEATLRRVVPELPIDRELRRNGEQGNI